MDDLSNNGGGDSGGGNDAAEAVNTSPTGADESGMDAFWRSPKDLAGIELTVPWTTATDRGPRAPNEAPGLRHLGRPPAWKAAQSPDSALSDQYASVQRRADEILRTADDVFTARRFAR